MTVRAKVEIYYRDECDASAAALALLTAKGVDAIKIDVGPKPQGLSQGSWDFLEMKNRAGRSSTPQIFINDRHIGGNSDLQALNRRNWIEHNLHTGSALDALLAERFMGLSESFFRDCARVALAAAIVMGTITAAQAASKSSMVKSLLDTVAREIMNSVGDGLTQMQERDNPMYFVQAKPRSPHSISAKQSRPPRNDGLA